MSTYCKATTLKGRPCRQCGKGSGGKILLGYCNYHKKYRQEPTWVKQEEVKAIVPVKPKETACFYLCDDLLEQIGFEVIKSREAWSEQLHKWRRIHNDYSSVKHQFKGTVKILAEHNKPITIKNMRYKYVKYEMGWWFPLWTWTDSLAKRYEKTQHHIELQKEH